MASVHMSDSEVAGDFGAVLEKVRSGLEVVVELDHEPVAVIRAAGGAGRPISEAIAAAELSGPAKSLDGGFGADVEEGIQARRRPWNPPSWD